MRITFMMQGSFCLALTLAIVCLVGCQSSKKREAGIQNLEKLQATVHGLSILVSAGVTKPEYSQRLEDLLLNVGDLNESENNTILDFPPKNQAAVKAAYDHLSRSVEAYKRARDYFGDRFDAIGCEEGCATLSQADYDREKVVFPALTPLQPVQAYQRLYPDSPPWYFRNEMVKALWKIAEDEDAAANQLIEQLVQT